MLSLEPSIKRGLTFWDRALLPPDEFDERVRLVRAEMRRMGLAALVIVGNMYEDQELVYLAGYNVDGVFVLPLEGEPAIFTNSGSREGFFLRELTWIADLSHRGAQIGRAVADTLSARGITGGRIGTAGLQVLAAAPYHNLLESLSDYSLQDFGPAYRAVRLIPRPRERAAVCIARSFADAAAAAAEQAFAEGASNAAAVIEAERVARRMGAWDVRILANLDGNELRPFERLSDERQERLVMWIATRYQGYWADRVVAPAARPDDDATKAVAAMVAEARAGAPVSAAAEAGLRELDEASSRRALAFGLGGGIGLALSTAPAVEAGSGEAFAEGMIVSFRILVDGSRPSLASALVEIGPHGARPIEPQRYSIGGAARNAASS